MSDESPTVYAVRFTERAQRDIDEARTRFVELAGEAVAEAWKDGVFETAATLAPLPRRQPAPESERFRQDVRQILYRRRTSSVAYRLFFTVDEEEDGPRVHILHIRHAAQSPLTDEEIQDIERG